jgi:pimeloyl-ACP methyl ester carboxylesterase
MLELARLAADPVFVPVGVPRGDGRPVLLLPGFLAGDPTLGLMAGWLYRLGYAPRTCGFVANADCSQRALERVERRAAGLYERHGRRVALLGHSRGGHLARALAASRPEYVSHAISLGADLQRMFGVSALTLLAVAGARRGVHVTRRARNPACLTEACDCGFTRHYAAPFPRDQVRLTSVYSKGDGVVCWERSIVPEADNVEVTGSHVGLIFNRKAYRAIAAALAEPELPVPNSYKESRLAGASDPR